MSPIDPSDSRTTYHDFQALTRLRGELGDNPDGALSKTAQQFEAYFLQEMMKSMRKTVEKSDLVENGTVDFYEEMLDKELAMAISKRGGIGLAQTLEAQIQRLKGNASEPAGAVPAGLPLIKPSVSYSVKPAAIKAYELMPKVSP